MKDFRQREIDALMQAVEGGVRDPAAVGGILQRLKEEVIEHQKDEMALRASEARLRVALEAAHMGAWERELVTGRDVWSEKQVKLFGLEPGSFANTHEAFLKLVETEDVAKLEEAERRAIGGYGPYHSEFRIRWRDGTVRWMAGLGDVIRGPDGRAVRMVGVTMDITEQKEAERALVEAKEAAEAASKSKDQFLAVVSHELRAPLAPILGAVTYLERNTDLDPEVREEIAIIRRNVEQESQLVDDLLNLARLAGGKVELHQEVVDAHGLLRRMVSEFTREAEGREISLTAELNAKEHYIWADVKRIRQVLVNLLHNAVKFTSAGGQICVRTVNSVAGRLRVEIVDTGIGIEPEVLRRLFKPFEQGETSITRKYGGLGLGLSISKGIVDLHGGELAVRSEGKGKGAMFVLEMRAVPGASEEKTRVATPAWKGIGYRVLLVEDHPDTLQIMRKMLTALGYSVMPASTLRMAMDLAEHETFDLLVSDIALPDGSGLDLMREMKRKGGVKGIAISGFGQPQDLTRSREAGFIDHLVKPLDFRRLETVLRQVTDGSWN